MSRRAVSSVFRKHYPGDERMVDYSIRLLKPADLT
jgi:hypothetical protein